MSDIIRLLPDSVANQIAAGEVIQRPASVIKELVENSVDAGATEIDIIITDAGRTLIQVVDNGIGMSATDARMAFERHATSKIAKADDLFALSTLGFRGEALASIAAISRVELKTKTKGSNIGTRLIINGSKVESQEAEMCADGSNMQVKNLFFNVPARRKFLKKDSVELTNILREFERLALVNTNVDFSISHNGNTLHQFRRGSLKQRIIDLFGKNLDKQLLPIETNTPLVKITGFISLPQFSKKRNNLQYLFVNGRNMRHPYFHKAIMQCYEELIPLDEQPSYFIDFKVDPKSIDVNIHPTKNEIKFEEESAIWQILTAAVKESLGRFNAMPGIDFSDDVEQIPVFAPKLNDFGKPDVDISYNPFENARENRKNLNRQSSDKALRQLGADWNQLYEEFRSEKESLHTIDNSTVIGSKLNLEDVLEKTKEDEKSLFDTSELIAPTSFITLNNRFIVFPSHDGLIIIEQHRAHVRVLYDRFLNAIEEKEISSQRIMFPERFSLTPAGSSMLQSILTDLLKIGFEISSLGGCEWNLTGYPSVLPDVNPVEIIEKIVEEEAEGSNKLSESLTQRIALSMAKSAAIKKGAILTETEIEHLIAQLFSTQISKYTPDGLPIIRSIDCYSILRLFD